MECVVAVCETPVRCQFSTRGQDHAALTQGRMGVLASTVLRWVQAHPRRHSDLMPRAAGPATTKTTRRKAPAGAPDRFHGTQVRNEYIMAETMANW